MKRIFYILLGLALGASLSLPILNAQNSVRSGGGGVGLGDSPTWTGTHTFTGQVNFNNAAAVNLVSNSFLCFNQTNYPCFIYASAVTPDSFLLALPTGSRTFHVVEGGDEGFDWAFANPTNPTFIVHSANQDLNQWIGLSHNQTDGILSAGTGSKITIFLAGNNKFSFQPGTAHTIAGDMGLAWTSSGNSAASGDTGFYRLSSGVVKVSDGGNGIRGLLGGGAAVASAAALPLPTGRVFHVTGTTNITSITSTNFQSGAVITLIFDGVLTFTDGGNIQIAGNFVTTAADTITLVYDGTNWHEIARAVN